MNGSECHFRPVSFSADRCYPVFMRKPTKKPQRKRGNTDSDEYKRFLETARESGASEDPKDFERAFKRVAQPKNS